MRAIVPAEQGLREGQGDTARHRGAVFNASMKTRPLLPTYYGDRWRPSMAAPRDHSLNTCLKNACMSAQERSSAALS